MGKINGERGLADATGSAKRDKTAGDEMLGQRANIFFPSDNPRRSWRKIGIGPFIQRIQTRWRRRRTNDRCHKAIASPSDIRHVGFGVLATAQHAPQLSDVESQAAIFHGQAGPRLFHEFGLADDLTLATDQNAENVERPATKLSSSAIAFQAASMRKDTERSEGKHLRHRLRRNRWPWSAAVRHRSHVF